MVKNSREFSLLDLDLEAFWFHFSNLLLSYENAYDCHPMSKPSVSAVLFGFNGKNLLKISLLDNC